MNSEFSKERVGAASKAEDASSLCAAIIMRTKNRTTLLPRALESVLGQTHKNWHLYLVNDGGKQSAVEDVVDGYHDRFGARLQVIHNAESLGMEAASNKALVAVQDAEFFAMHDDDDSWHPAFLSETIEALLNEENAACVAAAVRPVIIRERMEGELVVETGREEWPSWAPNIDMLTLLCHNTIPNNSILVRMDAAREVGLFNTTLRALGDWDYLLRLLVIGDIIAIDRRLSYYHFRPKNDNNYANSTDALHIKYDVVYRNSLIRAAIHDDPSRIGIIHALLRSSTNVEHRVVDAISHLNGRFDELVAMSRSVVADLKERGDQLAEHKATTARQFTAIETATAKQIAELESVHARRVRELAERIDRVEIEQSFTWRERLKVRLGAVVRHPFKSSKRKVYRAGRMPQRAKNAAPKMSTSGLRSSLRHPRKTFYSVFGALRWGIRHPRKAFQLAFGGLRGSTQHPHIGGFQRDRHDEQTPKLFVDRPQLVNDRASETIRGNLQIEGWAIAPEGVEGIDIFIDTQHFSTVKYGLRRLDVGAKWPNWPNSHLSGYAQYVPARALPPGTHLVRIELRTRTGRKTAVEFSIEAGEVLLSPLPRKIAACEIDLNENILSGIPWFPHFAIFLSVADRDDQAALQATLRSLRDQAYTRWHTIIICRDPSIEEELSAGLSTEFGVLTGRVSVLSEVGPFKDVCTREISKQPDLVGVLSPGDVLVSDALLQMAIISGVDSHADFFYGDERRVSPITGKVEPFFKPAWSPDLLMATNYIGRLWCARLSLLDRTGAMIEDWHQFGEYDLVLRCTEAAYGIQHISHLLCERQSAQIDSSESERRALERAMQRRCIAGRIIEGCAPGFYHVERRLQSNGMVSIIMPMGGNIELVTKCVSSILEITSYKNFELIILCNKGTKPEIFPYLETIANDRCIRIIDTNEPFNFSRICNLGAAVASGEFLLFLNDDIEVLDSAWLQGLMRHAERPEVGAVGARLLYPGGTIQHAGMFWTARGGRHAFRSARQNDPGYFGLAMTTRNVISVTGACIMMRRDWFDAIGQFNEAHAIVNNDVDLCLRCKNHGGLVVYEPKVTLIHHELSSRHNLPDEYEIKTFLDTWGTLLNAGDPYYNQKLSQDSDNYSTDEEQTQLVYAGYPLFRKKDINRIVIIKLDHIGDFVVAVPALERLQSGFPEAELYLVAPSGHRALVEAFAPHVKEVIEFRFFHTRSGLGELDVSDGDLAALERKLSSYHFDLAVDLRKHAETRPILRRTGARWLAGYDRDERFPWLDVALEWEDDGKMLNKRSHISDDLSRLVDAVVLAAADKRKILQSPASGSDSSSEKPVVCIHPGVGNEMRRWPAEHFAALIDLLVTNHDVTVLLIGGPDEVHVVEEVLQSVHHTEAIRSLAGATQISDLPRLLSSVALYVGNNSGPKHIAAGLGVPTIGIHSGVVDAREWGPIGPNAVAIRRDVRCSPCYLAKKEQCSRGLACLTELRPTAVYDLCKKFMYINRRPLSQKVPQDADAHDEEFTGVVPRLPAGA